MANQVMNIAKGAVAEKVRDGGTYKCLFLEATEADDVLNNYDTVATLLGAAGNTESAVAVRQTLASLTVTVDDVGNLVDVDCADMTFTPAAGNPVVKAILYHDVDGTDANAVPLTHHDQSWTPDGSQVTIQIAASGFFRAT